MRLRSRSWVLVLIFTLNILACEAGWVSKFQCDSSELHEPWDTPFRIDSLRGKFESPTIFSLSILAIHNTTHFTCSDLDLPLLETSFRFHVLGIPIGHIESFNSECPLPITETLTPPEGTLFSKYEILYSFGNAHRLQTVFAEISFRTQDGAHLDCAAAKITPEIGRAASVIFTYLPAVVMALVGAASWKTHANDALRWISLFESRAAWSILGPMWEIISDLAGYLQYLQFIFLAGSLTLKYPGFYQPIVSQAAWSSLLYWMGPIDHGFTYPGVEDGMYVTNGSYGLEYMSQTLGFPQMPDITIDSFINLSILLFAVVVISLILCLIMSRLSGGFHLSSVTWNVGCIIIGMALSFSSLPLLSYLSYELVLIGYLPNYRIILVGLSIAILVYSNFLLTRHVQRQKELNDSSSPDDFSQGGGSAGSPIKPGQYLSQYLPAAIPLLQGIVIGGLQDWGLVQVLLLMGTEIILLLHMATSLRGRLFVSISAWCTIVRLLTICLSITFACSSNETTKQWVGYIMLCLHGIMIIFGFLISALWQLTQDLPGNVGTVLKPLSNQRNKSNTARCSSSGHFMPDPEDRTMGIVLDRMGENRQKREFTGLFNSGSSEPSRRSGVPLNASVNSTSAFPSPTHERYHITDFSAFYRQPRHRYKDPPKRSSALNNSHEEPAENPRSHSHLSNPFQDPLDELMEVPIRPNIDYSMRESDLFYGKLGNGSASPVPIPQEPPKESQKSRNPLREWAVRAVETFNPKKKKKKKKEKGFQVMRPPRQN
ncbi:unnamed protein product [Penicillium egyptiacum]|uniref:ML-like domain-containing protein n=1 Tax=Penicillium egyptiacum TaxID=1303716 RepID=A0A9W4KI46_9EURO|nr:unnamed protein product [Penicillium egyptiacum]